MVPRTNLLRVPTATEPWQDCPFRGWIGSKSKAVPHEAQRFYWARVGTTPAFIEGRRERDEAIDAALEGGPPCPGRRSGSRGRTPSAGVTGGRQPAVEIEGRADQRQMRERLREVAEVCACGPGSSPYSPRWLA